MKSILCGLLFAAVVLCAHAEEDAKPKEGEIKIYKRLIPADVLRGELKISVRLVVESGASVDWDCSRSGTVEQITISFRRSRFALGVRYERFMCDVRLINDNSLRHSRRLRTKLKQQTKQISNNFIQLDLIQLMRWCSIKHRTT